MNFLAPHGPDVRMGNLEIGLGQPKIVRLERFSGQNPFFLCE